jgi:hypothetical protein
MTSKHVTESKGIGKSTVGTKLQYAEYNIMLDWACAKVLNYIVGECDQLDPIMKAILDHTD